MTEPERLEGVPGRYWHRLEDGRIQCDVCPRYCRLNEGQRGLCIVRGRQDDRIVLTTYGRSSGFCVDPIEKKPLNHYLPGTPVLSFGTAGCNLTCKFCQNWDISKARQLDRLQDAASPEDIVEAAIATGSRSIAYTYNDPVIFLEYAVDVAKVARRRGSKNVAVTAGYIDARARHEGFRESDALRRVFEGVVAMSIAAGLVGGEAFSIDASLIKADVDKTKRVPGDQPFAWPKAAEASHGVREYLAALDAAGGDE